MSPIFLPPKKQCNVTIYRDQHQNVNQIGGDELLFTLPF